MSDTELDWLISVDDHVLEPPRVWLDRLPKKSHDAAPHIEVHDEVEGWVYDDKFLPTMGLSAVVGKKREEFSPNPLGYSDMRPGCYDSVARLADMDQAGVLASICFPSFPRFCGQIFYEAKDKDFALLCVRAYNDWMVEEWCGSAPGRYIPLMIIPLWDPALAVEEMHRCAAMGVTTFAFSENPEPLGLPSIHHPSGYWLPVLEAANELEMVVSMHVGSSSTLPHISSDSPFMANLAWGASRTAGTMLSWLFSGHFQKLPNLKIALSEGNVGWIPYFLERAEQVVDKQRFWATKADVNFDDHSNVALDLDDFDIRAIYHEHVFGCLIEDHHGIRNLDVLGEDNVMIETDYPHSDSTWPDSIKVAKNMLAGLAPEVQYKVLRGNAERLFRFTPAAAPVVV